MYLLLVLFTRAELSLRSAMPMYPQALKIFNDDVCQLFKGILKRKQYFYIANYWFHFLINTPTFQNNLKKIIIVNDNGCRSVALVLA